MAGRTGVIADRGQDQVLGDVKPEKVKLALFVPVVEERCWARVLLCVGKTQ